MKAKVQALFKLIRIKQWWYSKIPLYLSFGLILGLYHFSFQQNMQRVFFLALWLIGGAAFGYFLNDCFDIEQDKKSGKPNPASNLKPRSRLAIVIALILSALAPWIILERVDLLVLAIAQMLIFLAYSIAPVRLKDRLYAGIIADSIYAYFIPVSMIVLLYMRQPQTDEYRKISLYLLLWAFAAGIRAIVYHHIDDRKKDAAVNMGNVVNKFGLKYNIIIVNILLIIELLAFGAFFIQSPYAFAKAGLLLTCGILSIASLSRYGVYFSLNKLIKFGAIRFFNFYENWLLFVVCVFAGYQDKRYFFVLLAFIPLFMVNSLVKRVYHALRKNAIAVYFILSHLLINFYFELLVPIYNKTLVAFYYKVIVSFYYKVILNIYIYILLRSYYRIYYHFLLPSVYIFVFNVVRPPVSFVVNHFLYLYRIWILRLTDNEARSRTTYIPLLHYLYIDKIESYAPIQVENDMPVHVERTDDISITTEANIAPSVEFLPPPLSESNKVVNGLWIGNWLSKIELLTITSFLKNGHEFHLWVYEPIKNQLPDGVLIKDANEIINASKIFRYKYANHFGHGKGSVSGFSDVFRYKLLFEKGGWWTDMDITCLRPLNMKSPYFFRSHHDLFMVGNIMKVPQGSKLMELCYKEASETINEENRDWHKPIEILNKYVKELNLEIHVFSGYSNEDKWDEVKLYAKGKTKIPAQYMVLHWMNEEWRSRKIDKNDLRIESTLAREMIKHHLLQSPKNRWEIWSNELRHLFYLPMIEFVNTPPTVGEIKIKGETT